jgi:hypothetical protein
MVSLTLTQKPSGSQRGLRAVLGPLGASICVVASLVLSGCDSLGGRTVTVEFASAAGILPGQPVFFAGVVVGETREPTVVAGRATVPVRLWRQQRDALPHGAAFAVGTAPDGSGRACLVGYDLGADAVPVGRTPYSYPGFASELELTLVVGVQRAREFWEALEKNHRH